MDRPEAAERPSGEAPPSSRSLSLADWQAAGRPEGRDLRLTCADTLDGVHAALARARRIVIEFPAFTDGRGFSHARRLRAHGFDGDLLAAGDVLPDQWPLLHRCGFSGLIDAELQQLSGHQPRFRHGYQADERTEAAPAVTRV